MDYLPDGCEVLREIFIAYHISYPYLLSTFGNVVSYCYICMKFFHAFVGLSHVPFLSREIQEGEFAYINNYRYICIAIFKWVKVFCCVPPSSLLLCLCWMGAFLCFYVICEERNTLTLNHLCISWICFTKKSSSFNQKLKEKNT